MHGSATVNGTGGYTYDVVACDIGTSTQPKQDLLGIQVNGNGGTYCNPSSACGAGLSAGTAGTTHLGVDSGGGTIQLHHCNPSFTCGP